MHGLEGKGLSLVKLRVVTDEIAPERVILNGI